MRVLFDDQVKMTEFEEFKMTKYGRWVWPKYLNRRLFSDDELYRYCEFDHIFYTIIKPQRFEWIFCGPDKK